MKVSNDMVAVRIWRELGELVSRRYLSNEKVLSCQKEGIIHLDVALEFWQRFILARGLIVSEIPRVNLEASATKVNIGIQPQSRGARFKDRSIGLAAAAC